MINVLELRKTLTAQENEGGPGRCTLGYLVEFSCKSELTSRKTFIRKEISRAPSSILEAGGVCVW